MAAPPPAMPMRALTARPSPLDLHTAAAELRLCCSCDVEVAAMAGSASTVTPNAVLAAAALPREVVSALVTVLTLLPLGTLTTASMMTDAAVTLTVTLEAGTPAAVATADCAQGCACVGRVCDGG